MSEATLSCCGESMVQLAYLGTGTRWKCRKCNRKIVEGDGLPPLVTTGLPQELEDAIEELRNVSEDGE